MNEAILYKTIFECLKSEDAQFTRLTDRGVFYAPELYMAIVLGKAIKQKENEIFGAEVQWIRETNFGNGGPTDFAFKQANTIFAFELKLRQTHYAYEADIEKLKRLADDNETRYQKYFIALVDIWQKDNGKDGRLDILKQKVVGIHPVVDHFDKFPTKQKRYAGEIDCKIGVWRVD